MRGRGMVQRAERPVRAADLEAALAKTAEGLRGGHLMDEMQIDVEDGRGVGLLDHDMRIPDLFEEIL